MSFRLYLTVPLEPRDPNPHILELQTALANSLVGSDPGVNFLCPEPATQCTWEQFHTLAVCANYRNVTDRVKMAQLNSTIYEYIFPEGSNITMDMMGGNGGTTVFHSAGRLISDRQNERNILNGIGKENVTDANSKQLLFFTIEMNWCLRTYSKIVASPAGIKEAPYTSEPLFIDESSIPHHISGAATFEYQLYRADSTQTLFKISTSLSTDLWRFVNDLLTLEIHSRLTSDEQFGPDTKFAQFLYYADMANVTKNLEETLTNQIRSVSPGDNEDAITFPGQAFYQETYWHVEWPWITVPIAEAFLTLLLLIVSVVATWKQPLFRSSALALLFHGLQESDLDMQSPYTRADPDSLERLARSVYVEFRENGNGVLKFVRAVKSDAV